VKNNGEAKPVFNDCIGVCGTSCVLLGRQWAGAVVNSSSTKQFISMSAVENHFCYDGKSQQYTS